MKFTRLHNKEESTGVIIYWDGGQDYTMRWDKSYADYYSEEHVPEDDKILMRSLIEDPPSEQTKNLFEYMITAPPFNTIPNNPGVAIDHKFYSHTWFKDRYKEVHGG
jgi:hypothetical protein